MLRTHDNWERLVAATLRREELYELFHAPSISSRSSDYTSASPIPDFVSENSPFSSRVYRNSVDFNDFDVESVVNVENPQTLRPNLIFVNGKLLDSRQLIILQICPNPPKKLKPGNYWYDKFAGFWGKQGQKPSQIISANLDLGGRLDRGASNGSSLVCINGQEITKPELRMLKVAGVRCYPDTHFWMNDDGSYQEEGHNMIRGSIWDKVGMKLICSLFSLPFPPKSSFAFGGLSVLDDIKQGDQKKFLLIGCSGSGMSTIFTQAKSLYEYIPFMEDELEDIKLSIRSEIYSYICILLESRQLFEDENLNKLKKNRYSYERQLMDYTGPSDGKSIYSSGPGLRAFSDWLLNILQSDALNFSSASLIQEFAPLVEELWRDSSFQETLKRTKELGKLPGIANYFLKRAVDVFKPDYEPSRMDILYTGGLSSSFSYMDFSFLKPQYDHFYSEDQQDFTQRYRLIRSPSRSLEESHEWLEMSEEVQVVIFSLSLRDYDQLILDENGTWVNKMILDMKYFASVVTRPIYDQTCVLLLLTKYDLFEEQIKQSPLSQCDWFDDFHPVLNRDGVLGNLGQMGFSYISVKFKRLYASLTGRKLYVKEVNSLDQVSVDAALKYAAGILKWDEEKSEYLHADYSTSDESSYSEESE